MNFEKKVDTNKVKPKLGYWDIRGLAQPIRYQLAYLGIDYEDHNYETSDQLDSTEIWQEEKKKIGVSTLPYYIDCDGSVIEGATAIQKYLAENYLTDLLGETNEEIEKVAALSETIHEVKKAITRPCYTGEMEDEEFQAFIKEKTIELVNYMQE